MKTLVIITCLLCGWSGAAVAAASAEPAVEQSDGRSANERGPSHEAMSDADLAPDLAAALAVDQGWPAGSVKLQLDRDPTIVPFGKGAIFVPAMTNPLDEPPVVVWQDGVKVAEATSGMRIALQPGRYQVRLGTGARDQRLTFDTVVRERFTTVVPAVWSGLTVHIIDEQLNSVRGTYELIRVRDRNYVGVGFGVDEQAGEPVATWVIEPGLYKLVQVGDTYRARKNFATVRLIEGRHTHFNVVIDPSTGDFLGAGEAMSQEVFTGREGFWFSLIVGGDLTFSTRKNSSSGLPDGEQYSARAFLDGKLNFELWGHPMLVQLQIEQGQTQLTDGVRESLQDNADLDGLYVYRWQPWIGPYLRFGAETNLLEGIERFDPPTDVVVFDENDEVVRMKMQAKRIRARPSFGFTTVKEGTGFNLRMFKTIAGEATVRFGVGGRHRIANQFLRHDSKRDQSGLAVFNRVPTTHQFGVEAILVATVRPARSIVLQFEVESFAPFDAHSDTDQLVIDADGTLSIKLTQYVSLNYVARYLRDTAASLKEPAREQNVLLRFSLALP